MHNIRSLFIFSELYHNIIENSEEENVQRKVLFYVKLHVRFMHKKYSKVKIILCETTESTEMEKIGSAISYSSL